MSVDVINALDGRAREKADSKAFPGTATEEFPDVLRSTLDDSGKSGQAAGNGVTDSPSGITSSERSNTGASTRDASSSTQSSRDETNGAGTDGEDSILDAAATGVAASALASARREGSLGESALLVDGRLSVQDAERTNAELAEGRQNLTGGELSDSETGVAGGRKLTAEEGATVETALNEAKLEGLTTLRSGTEVLEGRELDDSDTVDDRREPTDGGSRGEEEEEGRRASEQALFDRAAEGAQSAAVDPGLRQAIANSEAARQAPNSVAIEGAGLVANPVAGAVTETTTTSTPGAPTPPAASDAIAVQTEWLATRGGGTARLILSPANLGEIAIQVTLRGGKVSVVMVANEAIAQAVAEDQADRLAQAFANRDLRMDGFEVRRGNPESLTNGNLGQFDESNTRDEGATEENEAGHRRGDYQVQGASAQTQSAEQLELMQPQILSVGPEAGVDLRI